MEDKIIKAIICTFENKLLNKTSSERDWTRAILSCLVELAYEPQGENEIHVYGKKDNDCDTTINQWLYDMVWYERDENNNMVNIKLVLESEWKPYFEELRYDFNKLIQARAELRMFIFQAQNIRETIERLVQLVEVSKLSQEGDKYIFLGWHDNDWFQAFRFEKGKAIQEVDMPYSLNFEQI